MPGAQYRFLDLSPRILVTKPTDSCQLQTLDLQMQLLKITG